MPIGPDKAFGLKDPKSVALKYCQEFDNKIVLKQYSDRGDGKIMIIIGIQEFDNTVRKMIEDAYIEAGWTSAEVKTSKENGERPGLLSMTLSTNQQINS